MKDYKVMKKLMKILSVCALGFGLNAQAATITVGGVTWDPDFDAGFGVHDFSSELSFAQWWSSVGTTDNQTIEADNIADGNVLVPGNGELMGIATFRNLNGDSSSFVCATCSLNLAFGGLVLDNPGDLVFNTSNSWFNVFVTPQTTDPFNAGQYAVAQTGSVWLSGVFDDFALTSGNVQNGTSLGFLSVTGGDAFANFDTHSVNNLISGGLADLQISGTANFDGELFAQAAGLAVSGDTVAVSEPSVFALFGLSLLVLGARARRK